MEHVTLTTEMITVTRGATGNALDPGQAHDSQRWVPECPCPLRARREERPRVVTVTEGQTIELSAGHRISR